MNPDQYNYFIHYLTKNGLTISEAREAIRLDLICRIDSARRTWNELKPEQEKDREKQEDMRRQFSPNPCAPVIKEYNSAYVMDFKNC